MIFNQTGHLSLTFTRYTFSALTLLVGRQAGNQDDCTKFAPATLKDFPTERGSQSNKKPYI